MADLFTDSKCVICKSDDVSANERLVTMRSDGRKTLEKFSILQQDDALTEYLSTNPAVIKVHKSSQLRYTKD